MSKQNSQLATTQEIINEAKAGRMFILVDDENRENEGDLVIPAQFCDDQKINFMAKFGRGLICLALDEERVKKLELPLMSLNNESRHRTAFTVSIEARMGIATGISAQDRSKTILDAINPDLGKEAIVSPGHIFPLKAQNGGVLVRAGHTEASIDISRLANLNPSAVICEIMNDDGSMARMKDLRKFAKKHQLKIGSIADLIEYRRNNEQLVELVTQKKFFSKTAGQFQAKIYRSIIDNVEHIALIKGQISQDHPTLVRMHHLNITSDCLDNSLDPKTGILNKALKKINKNNNGVLVLIRQPSDKISDNFFDELNFPKPLKTIRNYGVGAQILVDLGIKNLTLLTNTKKSVIGLDAYGIKIVGYKKI
ncbi:3,4-dihydroxy-2-butanone-4-phosphate synthase [Alphaproteobacteria bacterium]|nr:3,4-dihydroxy-2-butanone-4-phosphate synthase [Alphaproteobacteria bacterium]